MKLLIIYHTKDENTTPVEDFADSFKRRTNVTVEMASLETREGASLAALYDAVSYPAILVLRDDGQLIKDWQGNSFPGIDEVMGYLSA